MEGSDSDSDTKIDGTYVTVCGKTESEPPKPGAVLDYRDGKDAKEGGQYLVQLLKDSDGSGNFIADGEPIWFDANLVDIMQLSGTRIHLQGGMFGH
ncbi:hypothetical protein TWF694_004406 [Orbilia ellipsospora]|uniref:Uncharacterized protein n=1 Tax=Orbilia ellipsospora TaxID=2528407 RepID=A0AAV9WW46_9PEZI